MCIRTDWSRCSASMGGEPAVGKAEILVHRIVPVRPEHVLHLAPDRHVDGAAALLHASGLGDGVGHRLMMVDRAATGIRIAAACG